MQNILAINLPTMPVADELRWTTNANRELTSKDANLLDQASKFPSNIHLEPAQWKQLWRSTIRKRFKLLLWKIVWNAMPTNELM